MPRFYLPPERCHGSRLTLDEDEAHHGLRVLRLRRGDQVSVLDGAGREYHCRVDAVTRSTVELMVERQDFLPNPNYSITLSQAVLKGKAFEFLVQKATELGVARLIPIITDRAVVQVSSEDAEEKRRKWEHVAIEAMKQCGNPWLPRIDGPIKFADALVSSESWDVSLVASLHPDTRGLREVLRPWASKAQKTLVSARVWIGPEGDFTPEEMRLILQAGSVPITLGRLVLRAETAGLCALSILSYELGSDPAPHVSNE